MTTTGSTTPAAMNEAAEDGGLRHDWNREEIGALYALPFNELLFRAQAVHRKYFNPSKVQLSQLLSIKTGGCPEDCAYCPQSAQYDTGVEAGKLMPVGTIVAEARRAKEGGASRFCMGAAWRNPKDRDIDDMVEILDELKQLGMETCMTLGMLTRKQADRLAAGGLDYYNHNIDTSPEYYGKIISTRTFDDRLETLGHVRRAGMKVCCGGIVGMGESREDRIGMLQTLANLPEHPESVPINMLVQVEGVPLYGRAPVDSFEFIRTIAVARLLMPGSVVRLSAGREQMNDEAQALCFLAGANSIFCGELLLTTPNPDIDHDIRLFASLGIEPWDERDGSRPPV